MRDAKTIVIGAGRFGSTIARDLSKKKEDVLVIDKEKDKIERLSDFAGLVEVGDATDIAFLEACGIKECDRVIIFTHNDNTNILISDICHEIFHVKEIYVRLNDSRKSNLIAEGVKCVLPFELSLKNFNETLEGGY